jgi:hypothetical protein
MRRFLSLAQVVLLSGTIAPAGHAQTSCGMPQSFNDPHPVLHDSDKSLFWVRPLQVDADGAPNAYHRDDPHGNKGLAIEYIGNGMTIERDGKPMPFELKEEENSEWLGVYHDIVRNGWTAPAGHSVDIYGFARDRRGRVCVGQGGQLISATSLTLNARAGHCNQKRYVNALEFPGIVVPNRRANELRLKNRDSEVAPSFAQHRVQRGDLAVVYHPETKRWSGALLYDTGPRHLLGEGSIRLVMNLRGMSQAPVSALETNSLGIVETFTILFPGSMADLGPKKTWTPEKIQRAAAERFRVWGGGSVDKALERLFACADEYKASAQPEPRADDPVK